LTDNNTTSPGCPPPEKPKKKIEFSKLILIIVMLSYFITVGVGIKLSLIDPTQFSTLAMLVGAPTATALGFYTWKARTENMIKFKQRNPKETGDAPIDLHKT
jgi:hypothetical protein